MKNNGNFPVFPIPNLRQCGQQSENSSFDFEETGQEGIGYRDYCAIKTMQGILAGHNGITAWPPQDMAAYAYEIADAMLEQRNK